MGMAPEFSRNVGLILHPGTGYISPQFLVCYDDWFTTVYTDDETSPLNWQELLTFQSHRVCDEEGVAPPLEDHWLTCQECTDKKLKQAE